MKAICKEIKQSPYLPMPKKIIDYKRETPDSFTIRLDWKLDHDPGQFVFCSVPGIGEAPISICSHSNEHIDLNIREVGSVTKALGKFKKGDKLLVRGPYGKPYPMHYFDNNNVIIVGGGCGIAPLKGLIDYVIHNREKYQDVSLYLGFRSPDDTLFKEDIPRWQDEFKVHVSFDKAPDHAPFCGSQGFVTQAVDEEVHDNVNKIVFICGPPVMINATADLLINKGFNDDQIYVSAERLMYCGVGKCGRCMIHGRYTCQDGAVFRYDEIKDYKDA